MNEELMMEISIHALLAESDYTDLNSAYGALISIHALLAESDKRAEIHASTQQEFLSTLSLRRATDLIAKELALATISIHALLAESDDVIAVITDAQSISIHALLAESDIVYALIFANTMLFLSTLSLRRATAKVHKTVGHFCAEETHFMESALPSWQ